jgi:hypothetical protein
MLFLHTWLGTDRCWLRGAQDFGGQRGSLVGDQVY